jgi:RND family efflux transporter MFP subunit
LDVSLICGPGPQNDRGIDCRILGLKWSKLMARAFSKKKWWLLASGSCLAAWIVLHQIDGGVAEEPRASDNTGQTGGSPSGTRSRLKVAVVKPRKGGIPRQTVQPGSMESFDYADLYAKVSGYLKTQIVDIGDTVKAGQTIAEIEAPELVEELHEEEAAVARSEAEVVQMESRVTTANAEYDAAVANITFVEANLAKATSYLKFREIQFKRISDLFAKKSIEERLVDEKEEERDSAQAAENSARAAIVSARAQATAVKARVASAEADLLDAKAKVRLARAKVARAQVWVDYMKIVSPYNGVITRRSFHVGDFIRTADQGGTTPLLTVARTDVMRVVVQVPERDVPYTDVGDIAIVEMDALAGEKFPGKVARFANSEDRLTRTMRTEIDLPNPRNRLRDGMFGRVTIVTESGEKGITVPSTSLLRDSKQSALLVVRKGKIHRLPVEIGQDDGSRTEVLSGLTLSDEVVINPSKDLTDGAPVDAESITESAGGKAALKSREG